MAGLILKRSTLVLQLPPLCRGFLYLRVIMESSVDYSQRAAQPVPAPFHADPDVRLFVLTCYVYENSPHGDPEDGIYHEFRLVVPAHTFLSRLPVPGPTPAPALDMPPPGACRERFVLPWYAWGAEARFMEHPPADLCGSRYLTVEAVPGTMAHDAQRMAAVVYDFAPVPALLADVRQHADGAVCSVPEPMHAPHMVAAQSRPVDAAAPCRRVVSSVVVGDDENVRMFEDGLVVYGVPGEGPGATL